jgi:hypothetical protein
LRAALAVLLLGLSTGSALGAGRSAGSASLIIGKLAVGTRATALGGAYTAMADDPSAIWWNPACLARINSIKAGVSHVEQGEDVKMENALFAWPVVSGGSLGIGASYLGMPPIREELEDPLTGNYLGTGGEMTAYQWKGAAGFGQFLSRWGEVPLLGPLWERGAIGASVAVLGEQIGSAGSYSVGVDVGYLYDDPASGRRFGLVARDLGAPTRGAPLPVTGQAGVAQDIDDWSLSVDVLTATDDSYRLRGGAEWTYKGTTGGAVSLRLGAQHSFSSHLNAWLSMGLGYRLTLPGSFEASIDYSYVPVDSFEDLHAIAIEVAL